MKQTFASVENTIQRLRVLEELGSTVISTLHFAAKKARSLPCPMGKSIGYVEDTLTPWLEPLLSDVAEQGLHLLSLADNKINAASDAAVEHIPFASLVITPLHLILSGQAFGKMLLGYEKLRHRGVVGCAADIWAEYEPVVKNKSRGIYQLMNRVPCLNLAVYTVHELGSPLVLMASEWLMNHSEKDKPQLLLLDLGVVSSSADSSSEDTNDLRTDEDTDAVAEGLKTDEDVNTDANELDTDSHHSHSPGGQETGNFSAASEGTTSEVSEGDVHVNAGEDKWKGKKLQMPLLQEEEQDDPLMDLFDTWALGVTAISPKGLENLRSLSLNERSNPKHDNTSKPGSKSFRY